MAAPNWFRRLSTRAIAAVEFVDASGNPAPASSIPVSAATITNVNSGASSAQLLAANTSRRGVVVVNTDANALLLKYGQTASTTSYTYRIPGNFGQWEMPEPVFTGRIDGIWEADGAGIAVITEF